MVYWYLSDQGRRSAIHQIVVGGQSAVHFITGVGPGHFETRVLYLRVLARYSNRGWA
jgi:hypothetical protein